MRNFQEQDKIPQKLRIPEGYKAAETFKFLTEPILFESDAQWFRAIRILEAFAEVDDDYGKVANRMLEAMDRE